MTNIDINLKNSKFYIVEVRVDDYRNGEHYFNTSDNIFLFKYQAEKIKNELFKKEVSELFSENDINIPENLDNYDGYDINTETINDSDFTENYSWIDSEDIYLSVKIKELTVNTNL